MQIYSKTDIGLKRSSNQDSVATGKLDDGAVFAVVCDGMGGANAGNVASEMASKSIFDYITSSYRSGMNSFEIERMLKNAIESANIEIYDMSLKSAEYSGMGTTAVITVVRGDTAIIAHVGDSRAYMAGEELLPLTRDHSVVQSLIESGKITPEDAKVHPRKNVITRALGAEENVVADSAEFEFPKGSVLMLCTDGLTGYADEEDIFAAIKADNGDIAEELVKLAYAGGGGDNITVVTISNR